MFSKFIYFLTQTMFLSIFTYELPKIYRDGTANMGTARRTVPPLHLHLLSSETRTTNCFFKNNIVSCNFKHNTLSNMNFDKATWNPLHSEEFHRSNNEIPQKSSKRFIQYSHNYNNESITNQKLQRKQFNVNSEYPTVHRKHLWDIFDHFLPPRNTADKNGIFNNKKKLISISDAFIKSQETFNRKFYNITFNKLLQICPSDRKVNGISFVGSGLFLQLLLLALTDKVDPISKDEIEKCVDLQLSKWQKLKLLNNTITQLPASNSNIKFYWSYRLMLWPGADVSQEYRKGPVSVLRMHINRFNGTERPNQIVKILNKMIERDSGGAIRNTFEEEDVSNGMSAILLNTLYLRARWRSAPTVLNGTRPFRDTNDAPQRTTRMIRINDMMRYAHITEWNAEAVEIFYATSGLSLLLLVPRNQSLQNLAARVLDTSINEIVHRMRRVRIAAVLPLYTLRMTLLLPNKLQDMGITQMFKNTDNPRKSLKISHAVQRLMFWAEAGRNAFKDDGIEWDEKPELELIVDCPYIFYVRWNNMTLMNGNFVL